MMFFLIGFVITLTYLSGFSYIEQRRIISVTVLGSVFYFQAPYMNNIFGRMHRRSVYETYPDKIWEILGIFFTFIGVFLFVTNKYL